MKKVHAAIGVIFNKNKQILIAERLKGKVYAGYWELPGGKIEQGETPDQALKREFFEELGIESIELEFLKTIEHQYPEFLVILEVFKVLKFSGTIYAKEGQKIAWLDPNNPSAITPLLPASNEILELL